MFPRGGLLQRRVQVRVDLRPKRLVLRSWRIRTPMLRQPRLYFVRLLRLPLCITAQSSPVTSWPRRQQTAHADSSGGNTLESDSPDGVETTQDSLTLGMAFAGFDGIDSSGTIGP